MAHPYLRSLIAGALRLGPRPQHMAFIMDGNRRSARQRSLPVRVGHEEGFEALKRVLGFLLKLGVPHVTVYAFSIENFNREPAEVDALLEMARTRLVELCEKGELLDRHGVQIRIIGRRDLLPVDVQEACARAEAMTAHNKDAVLHFVSVNWPDIGVLDVLPPLLQYQAECLASRFCSVFYRE
ncbi:cis-prenyltransferase [Microbotryomycetes sp. JL201]|nr:cis-prenyltransferase [Microbotryomycetes sp. JL201]